ncbi:MULTISPECIES: GNAT family N-acetyltransferase [Actinoalloteichus]|uniref:Lysine N-acyltransferase MbtK n=1 Tax=Actinoalloteichus fjordicus TaxID=1612552 RepID=A0AAC9PRA2_9PSEU|nr:MULTISPECIES: GNAT family N-acetyltransferase [Actinoalloteichus]APU14089.1 acetyltransferase, ribosomal protein N-acetylase [Actinoalloteichus fjordicus]APU20036.1 acetyltransferase, ribosomal protein N-acetylase [Actinoalloteichus sp. GBA129-24]
MSRIEVGPPPLPQLDAPWEARWARAEGPDLDLVHDWMNRDHVAAFWHQDWPRERWREELAAQSAGDHSRPVFLLYEGSPLAYLEVYRASRDRLAACYPVQPHDLGVHVAIGDRLATGRGLGRALLGAVARGLLRADPACDRVVAEPDVANPASVRAFLAAGFVDHGEITLPDKTAALLIHPRRPEPPADPDRAEEATAAPPVA